MKLGTNTIASLKIGSTDISEVRLGSVLVWQNVTYLLDLYPATVAYSLRKIRSAYSGNAIRVRRSSDNTEQDIGFTGNILDTTSLASFVGLNDGFITKWYNQGSSGSTNDLIQTTLIYQPRIVNTGVIHIQNSKPAIEIQSLNSDMAVSGTYSKGDHYSVFRVNGAISSTLYAHPFTSSSVSTFFAIGQNGSTVNDYSGSINVTGRSVYCNSTNIPSVNRDTIYDNFDNNSQKLMSYLGCTETAGLGATIQYPNASFRYYGSIQEYINFAPGFNPLRTAIETDINNYYGIY